MPAHQCAGPRLVSLRGNSTSSVEIALGSWRTYCYISGDMYAPGAVVSH